MTGWEDLENRIGELEDIEAIKKLKAKYFRSIDRKLWDELAECFTEDGIAKYGAGRELVGVTAIVEWVSTVEGGDHVVTTHQGNNPEIELTGDTTARGTWALYYYRGDNKEKAARRAGGYYEEDYVKQDGTWKMKRLTCVIVYSEQSRMGD